MKNFSTLLTLFLTLLCGLVFVVLLKELDLFSIMENLIQFIGICIVSLCFVLTFEPVIERVPVSSRTGQCLAVYVFLFGLVLVMGLLLIPVIFEQWDSVVDLLKKMRSMNPADSEMTLQVEKAFSGVWPVLQQVKDGLFSYILAFFISLEAQNIRVYLDEYPIVKPLFDKYDQIKDQLFQYAKAMFIDIGILFAGQCLLMGIFQVNSFVSLALFLALMNIIPYFGSTLALVFVFLVDYLSYGQFRFGMILSVFLFQQIEANCLQPMLFGKMMNVKPLYIVVSMLFFGSVFGLTGVVFAPIFAVMIQSLWKVKKSSSFFY